MAARGPLPALFEVDSSGHTLSSPPSALRRDEYAGPRTPSAYELEHLTRSKFNSSENPGPSLTQTPAGIRTPAEEQDDLEMSRPASPYGEPTEIVPSLTNPPMNKWRFVAAAGCFFANGINDSSTGAIIPYMEAQYDISYGIVSIIFVTNAVGFGLAALYTNWLDARVGRAYHMLIAQLALVAGYAILVTTPPFWLVCVAFFLTGSGMAMGLAPCFVFVCNLANSTTLLGIIHGVYGLGGACGPLIATGMVDSGIRWSIFYAVLLAFAALNAGTAYWTNRGFEEQKPSPLLAAIQQHERRPQTPRSSSYRDAPTAEDSGVPTGIQTPDPASAARPKTVHPTWREILSRTTVIGSAFIFAYQGAEVSISGWVLSFLLAYRAPPFETSSTPHGPSGYNPMASNAGSYGYITSGFWVGITLSRIFATDKLAHVFGAIWAVAGLTALAGFFQLLVWLIPNLIAESVVIAILGGLLGPIYPLTTLTFTKYLERRTQTSSLAVVTAVGSSGGAAAPFLVGIVSQAAGVWVLHPICLGLYAAMASCWLFLNWGKTKRRD